MLVSPVFRVRSSLRACTLGLDLLAVSWAVVPALIVMIAGASSTVPLAELTRDQSALVFELKSWAPYYGLISNLGVSIFLAAVGVLLITVLAVPVETSGPRSRSFMMFGLAFTAALAIDDLFLFHEAVPDILIALGWPAATAHRGEKIVYLAYAVAGAIYLWRYRGVARTLGGLHLLLLASALFAISASVDGYLYHFFDWRAGGEVWLEDGTKLIGVNSWLVAQVVMCRRLIASRPRAAAWAE